MSERVVNLFLYVEGELIKSLGATAHDFDGNDEQANAFLQSRVAADAPYAIRYPIPVANIKTWLGVDAGQGLPLETFDYFRRMGKGIWLFEDALQKLNAPQTPLVCTTFIVDGKPVIHSVGHANPPACPINVSQQFGGVIKRTDWLAAYITPLGLNVHDLLHDDFTEAIKLLYEHKHYVSAIKLLVSFVDTVAFLDFGDVAGNYQMWLSKYANLTPVGVTPSELWEFRSSILHMTNPLSRKVLSGNVLPLAFYIDPTHKKIRIDQNGGTKMFSFEALHEAIIEAVEVWTKSYSKNLPKQLEFIRRYDTVLSEGRISEWRSKPAP
jgi:hypothetical protein